MGYEMAGCGFNIGLLDYFMEVAWMLIWFFFSQAFFLERDAIFWTDSKLNFRLNVYYFFFGLKELRKVVNVGKLMFVIHENSIFFL